MKRTELVALLLLALALILLIKSRPPGPEPARHRRTWLDRWLGW